MSRLAMATLLNLLSDSLGYLWTAPAWLLLLIVINLVGVYLQWVKWFPNQLIPVVLVVLSIVPLEFLVDPKTIVNPSPHLVIGLVGFIIGVIAYALHFSLVKAWRKWWPQQQNT